MIPLAFLVWGFGFLITSRSFSGWDFVACIVVMMSACYFFGFRNPLFRVLIAVVWIWSILYTALVLHPAAEAADRMAGRT
ncbi:MAG: hypothetical protein KBA30_09165, partial [Clostridia bacterium]|nr:hypothetical protein [Clostridia bacterium]